MVMGRKFARLIHNGYISLNSGDKRLQVRVTESDKDVLYSPLFKNTVLVNMPGKSYPFITFSIKNTKTRKTVQATIDDQCIGRIIFMLEAEKKGAIASQAIHVHREKERIRCLKNLDGILKTNENSETMNHGTIQNGLLKDVYDDLEKLKTIEEETITKSSNHWMLLEFFSEKYDETAHSSVIKAVMHILYRWHGKNGEIARKPWRINIVQPTVNQREISAFYDLSTDELEDLVDAIAFLLM